MGRTLEQVIRSLPKARRAKVEARAAELIAEEMTLRDLRKAMRTSQTKIAKLLGTNQAGVSKLERRADMLLSTLRAYVEAMGGRLVLVADLPGRPSVALSRFSDLEPEPKKAPSPRRATGQGRAVPAVAR